MDIAKVWEGFNDFLRSQLSRPSTTVITKSKAELIRKEVANYSHKYTVKNSLLWQHILPVKNFFDLLY